MNIRLSIHFRGFWSRLSVREDSNMLLATLDYL